MGTATEFSGSANGGHRIGAQRLYADLPFESKNTPPSEHVTVKCVFHHAICIVITARFVDNFYREIAGKT